MIRRAVPSDLPDILEIYAIARRFMAQAGNPDQWRDVYPPEDLVQDDIRQGFCHVCVLDGRIQGVFAAMCWDDPDYQVIQGAWLSDRPYWAVHRVASRGEVRGVAARCLCWCLERGGSVRIGHCRNATFALELCTELRRRFPGAEVKSYPLRGLCSYYAEHGGIMLGFAS